MAAPPSPSAPPFHVRWLRAYALFVAAAAAVRQAARASRGPEDRLAAAARELERLKAEARELGWRVTLPLEPWEEEVYAAALKWGDSAGEKSQSACQSTGYLDEWHDAIDRVPVRPRSR